MSQILFAYLWSQAKLHPRVVELYAFKRIQSHHTIVYGHRKIDRQPPFALVTWACERGNRQLLLRVAAMAMALFKVELARLRRRRSKCDQCRDRFTSNPLDTYKMELKHAACQRVVGCAKCCRNRSNHILCLYAVMVDAIYPLVNAGYQEE